MLPCLVPLDFGLLLIPTSPDDPPSTACPACRKRRGIAEPVLVYKDGVGVIDFGQIAEALTPDDGVGARGLATGIADGLNRGLLAIGIDDGDGTLNAPHL